MAGLKGWALPQLDLPADHGQVGQRQHGQHQQHGHDLSAAAGPDDAGDEEPGDFHQDEEHGQQVHVDGQGGQQPAERPSAPSAPRQRVPESPQRRQHQAHHQRVHLSFLTIPDQVGGGGDEQRAQQRGPRADKSPSQRGGQRHSQCAGQQGEVAQRELAVAAKGQPAAQQQEVEWAVLAGLAEGGQQRGGRPGGEAQRVHLVPPQALEVEAVGADGKGQEDQEKRETGCSPHPGLAVHRSSGYAWRRRWPQRLNRKRPRGTASSSSTPQASQP